MLNARLVTTEARTGQDLIWASRPFANEQRARSWLHVATTLALIAATLTTIQLVPWIALKAALSFLAGLLVVRGFILFHDFQHNALLRGSKVGKSLFGLYGLLVLTPPTVWRATHNYHHAHTAKIVGSHVGSYLMVTTEIWEKMSAKERLVYKVYRHPLTIVFAYFTVFFYGMCISSWARNKTKNWDDGK